jgi:hypothetical protein
MIVMKSRRELFNFYESFSDLIFNTLVLFLFLILGLVVNVNKRVESVARDETRVAARLRESEQRLEELRKSEVALVDRRAELDKEADALKVAVQMQQRRVQDLDREIEKKHADLQQTIREQDQKIVEAKDRINDLEGTNRFTGGIGRCRIFVVVDVSTSPETFYVVPATLMEDDRLEVDDLAVDAEGERRRNARLFEAFQDAARPGGMSREQLSNLIAQTSLFWQFGTGAKLGIRMENRSTRDGVLVKSIMVQGGPFKDSGGLPGDIIVSIDGDPVADFEDLIRFLQKPGASGATFKLGVLRGGARRDLSVVRTFAGPWQMETKLHHRFSTEFSQRNGNSLSADALSARIKQAFDALASQPANLEVKSHPSLTLRIPESRQSISITPNVKVTAVQLAMYLRGSMGTRIAVDVVLPTGVKKIPDWFKDEVMLPTGFVTRVPEVPFFGQEKK